MKPEERARKTIDTLLEQAGWLVQDFERMNLSASHGTAVREFSLSSGTADYLLFIDHEPVGIIEAKKTGQTLIGVEEQSAKYLANLPDVLSTARSTLPFSYESTGIETRFTNHLDPEPRSRQIFAFHQPKTLAEWLEQAPIDLPNEQNDTLRARLRRLPPLPRANLRECQVEAITNLEDSFAQNKPRALIQMATGSGKTFTAVSSIYRLIKFAGARRVIFLVDRADLGRQAFKEFQQYVTPDDGRKFTELYNVQHLQSNRIDPVARVCITTIQRLYSMLSGEAELDPAMEEQSLFELDAALFNQQPREVQYNPIVPIETFDIIITDECHRSIYNLWRGVLEYFDAFMVGLTATPSKQTYAFFKKNLVMEYGHTRAVADGVNVDYQVYRIRTEISEKGSTIEPYEVVGRRDRQTRALRWERLDDELTYDASRLDREVVAPDQIRTVLQAYKDALFTQLFPGRREVPKTLIFAKDDSHAEAIVEAVREVFGRGNQFAQKITYKVTGVKPEKLIQDFRISYYPRIAVTVDMISTGTDIKPLEVLLFMRSVKSAGFFEQMKGRGTRTISDTDFQAVTPDARSKTHFVLIDAVGICERIKTDDPPLERNASVSFKNLLNAVALGKRDAATLTTLAGRLGRLDKRATPDEMETITQASGGRSIRDLAAGLVDALDPDKQLEVVQQETGELYLTLDDAAAKAIVKRLIREATAPFDNPDVRTALIKAQQRDEQTLDVVSEDKLISADWDMQAEERARQVVTSFRQFIEQHRDEITALEVFYSRPRYAGLQLEDIKKLAEAIAAPPLGLSTDKLWQAYETLDRSRVRGGGKNVKRMLTDLVSLVRYTLERDEHSDALLEPYSETVTQRFAAWLEEQERMRGKPFTTEQRQWLELIREHVAASLTIETDDFEYEPFSQRGGLGRAYQVFGTELSVILQQLNERLAA